MNPAAGKGRALRVWREVESKLADRGIACECRFTPGPGTVTGVARQYLLEGCDRIVAVGGDGTMREAASAIAGSSCCLGIVPAGTGNDFARTLGVPRDIDGLIPVLVGAHARGVDLGRIDGHYFVNVAGVGIDAEIIAAVDRSPMLFNSTLTYLVSTVKTLSTFVAARMKIVIDGRPVEGQILVLAIGNGQYYGGGIRMVPSARVDDGVFHVVVAKDISRLEALRLLPLTYSGRHVNHRKCSVYTGTEITVEADRPLSVQADGTLVGRVPVTFTVVPGALRVLAPAGDS